MSDISPASFHRMEDGAGETCICAPAIQITSLTVAVGETLFMTTEPAFKSKFGLFGWSVFVSAGFRGVPCTRQFDYPSRCAHPGVEAKDCPHQNLHTCSLLT